MRKARWNVLHIILLIYLLFSVFFSTRFDLVLYNMYINPLVLFVLACFTFVYSNNTHGRFVNLDDNKKTVLIATLFYIIIYFISGLIFGFSKTIYSHDIAGLLINIYQFILPIICIEYMRSYVINDSKNNKSLVILFTVIFTLMEINYPRLIASFSDYEGAFQYIAAYILPIIFGNVLYTYLTIVGSYKLVLVYRLIIQGVYLITPIFPYHDWFIMGVFGILAPSTIYMSIKFELSERLLRNKKDIRKAKSKGFIPTVIIMVLFVLFMAGFFKWLPIAILSNSMSPYFTKGDVVVYSKKDDESLKNIEKDTIIVYSKEGQYVVHRVIDKYERNGKYYFVTKGDANLDKDLMPVLDEDVMGIYKFHIKYIGYPSVWLNRFFRYQDAKVEIK